MRYKALNIPQNGLNIPPARPPHPDFQKTALAKARAVLKSLYSEYDFALALLTNYLSETVEGELS